MSEQPVEHTPPSGQPVTERAEELLEQWERQARFLIVGARQQLRHALASTPQGSPPGNGQESQPAAQPEPAAQESPSHPMSERAEARLDEWGQWVGRSASLVGQQLHKMAARAREEAEDVLAEARHIQQKDSGK
jgi:hypothetical protein